MYFMNLTFARDDALISERQLVDTAECTARSCPFPWLLPSLVQMRQNWIVNMLQLGAVKLNSPSRPSCKPDWQGATRCSGPLVVNDVISFITGGTGSVVTQDVVWTRWETVWCGQYLYDKKKIQRRADHQDAPSALRAALNAIEPELSEPSDAMKAKFAGKSITISMMGGRKGERQRGRLRMDG